MSDKLLPQDLLAEKRMLGSMLSNQRGFMPGIFDLVPRDRADWFMDVRHRAIIDALVNMHEAGKPITDAALYDGLRNVGMYETAGGEAYILDTAREVGANAPNVRSYATIVREKALARETIEAAKQVIAKAHAGDIDAADYAQQAFATVQAIAATDEAEPAEPVGWTPFPVDLLPRSLARFTTTMADAMFCDPAMVALPALATAAAAIGTTRALRLTSDWLEWPIIWCCIVMRSGSNKSAPHKAATHPLEMAEWAARKENEAALREFNEALASYKAMKPRERTQTPEPQPPIQVRHTVADVTIEALAPILENNLRGVLVSCDELASLFASFNQYKPGGKGADRSHWLQLWQAGKLQNDRKTGDKRSIYVPIAAASICGTMQPGVFRDTFNAGHFDSGLVARLLFVSPPQKLKRFTNNGGTEPAKMRYADAIRGLLALQHAQGKDGPEQVELTLTAEAEAAWAEWYNPHAQRQYEAATDGEAAYLAKIEAYAARFALIFGLLDSPRATSLDADAVRRGCSMAQWFIAETGRLYSRIGETAQQSNARELLAYIRAKGGAVTARTLQREGHARYRPKGKAAEALAELVRTGAAEWEHPAPGPKGGPPSRVCRLKNQCDTTPQTAPPNATQPPAVPAPTGDMSPVALSHEKNQEIENDPSDDTLAYAAMAEAEAVDEPWPDELIDAGGDGTDWARA